MNFTYRIIFNKKTKCHQAVGENAKGTHAGSDQVDHNQCNHQTRQSRTLLKSMRYGLSGMVLLILSVFGHTVMAAHDITSDETITTSQSYADAVWISGPSTSVEVTGTGALLEAQTGYNVTIGSASGSNVHVKVNNGGSVLAGNKLFLGADTSSQGYLTIGADGYVSAQQGGNLGAVQNSSGSITVENGGVLHSASEYFLIGGDGEGFLQIDAGGKVIGDSGLWGVGYRSTATGKVIVDGEFILTGWDAPLSIGQDGAGTMNVNAGGKVGVGGFAIVGEGAGDGELYISGSNATFEVTGSGSLRAGMGSGTGKIVIDNGGSLKLNGGDLLVGIGSGSGDILITGSNSKLESTGTTPMEIGSGSGTGSVTVADNSALDINASQIIVGSGSGSGSLNIGAAKNAAADVGGFIVQNNPIQLDTNGELVFNHTDSSYVFASPLSGDGKIYKTQAGTKTILSEDNPSFSGEITINAGVLQVGNGGNSGSIGSADVAIAANAKLQIDRTGTMSITGDMSGAGKLEHIGVGTTILTGTNSYSGGTLVSAGTLQGNTTSLQGDIVNNSELVFNQDLADGTYTGQLSGPGILTKTGSYQLTLGANASAGQVDLNVGALNIGAGKTLSVSNGLTMASGTTLGVDVSSTPAVTANDINLLGNNTINITGYSPRSDTGVYTLASTTNGVNGGFETTVAGAALHTYVDLSTYIVGSAWVDGDDIVARLELVWNNNDPASAHGTFDITAGQSFNLGVALADNTLTSAHGFGWNGRDLTKTGDGTLILNGVNTYTGVTDIRSGQLIVGDSVAYSNAQIAGHVDVQNGATLGGHGRINGTVTVHGGGTLSPGNSIGTLTVADAVFNQGSTYLIDVNPDGSADKLVANSNLGGSGTVVIQPDANLSIQAGAGNWDADTRYLIIDTDGGVTGEFSNTTSNLAFLTAAVDYDIPNQVWLGLKRNSTSFGDLNGSYNQTQTGWGIESLGNGNKIYDAVLGMSRAQALYAFDNLSGEIHGSAKSAILTNRYARDAVNKHLLNSALLETSDVQANKALWISAWGHDGHLKGDGNAARLDNQGWGFLVGADAYNSGQTVAGLALGYERIDTKVGSTRNSSADIDVVHLLTYGRTSVGPIDVTAGLGYSWLDVKSSRNVHAANIYSKNQANYNGGQIQAYIEGSHRFDLSNNFSVSPYLNVAYQRVQTDSFTEEGDDALLQGARSNNYVVTTTAGVRSQWRLGEQAALYGDLGWQHRAGDMEPEAKLNFIGGTQYSIKGVRVDRNQVLIGLGGEYRLKPNMQLSAGYEGQFGSQSKDHALKVQFDYKF